MRNLNMRPHGTGGRLITFCGLDGCGKSTMIRRLADWLREREIDPFLTRQPTDFVRQSAIFRTYMDEPNHDAYDYRSLSLLAASDRVQHVSKVILPALGAGRWVVSDRYFYSCAANLRARGYTQDRWIEEIAQSIVQPDIAFFLDVPVETAIRRVRSRPEERDRYIDRELQVRLREEYRALARGKAGVLLDATKSEEETFAEVLAAIGQLENKTMGGKSYDGKRDGMGDAGTAVRGRADG